MPLTSAQLRELHAASEALVALAPAQRGQWIEAQSALDPEIKARLLRSIASAVSSGGTKISAMQWLKSGQIETLINDETAPSALMIGSIVGRYRVVRWIGSGGMGEVWESQRADGMLERSVALKIPTGNYLRRNLASRFARERSVLALLKHANIATLYDAGLAENGTPYLAMEYVQGMPITAFCDSRKFSIRQRLALFQCAASAVAYAHAQLIVHRDLKPSNVLVNYAGEVKLLDFGVAKILENDDAHEENLTREAGVALTANYASPEQLAGAPPAVSADVYALGVMLYEIVAGKRPYALKRGEGAQALRALSVTAPSRAFAPEAVENCAAGTRDALQKKLAGDLDAVILKALEFDPERRYRTVAELTDDLGRILGDTPVQARSVGARYRVKKFIQRNRLGTAVGVGFFATLLIGTSLIAWQAKVATREAQRAHAVESFLLRVFDANATGASDPANAIGNSARDILRNGARLIDADAGLQGQPRRDVLIALAQVNTDLGEFKEGMRLGMLAMEIPAAQNSDHALALTLAHAAMMGNDFPAAQKWLQSLSDPSIALPPLQRFLRDALRAYTLRYTDYAQAATLANQALQAQGVSIGNDRFTYAALQRIADVFDDRDDGASIALAALIVQRANVRFGPQDPRTVEAMLRQLDASSRAGDVAMAHALVIEIKRIVVGEISPSNPVTGGWWLNAKRNAMDSPQLMNAALGFARHQTLHATTLLALYDAGAASTIAARLRTGTDSTLTFNARLQHSETALRGLRLDLADIHTKTVATLAKNYNDDRAARAYELRADALTLQGEFAQATQLLAQSHEVRTRLGSDLLPRVRCERALREASIALGQRDWTGALTRLENAKLDLIGMTNATRSLMAQRFGLLQAIALSQRNDQSISDARHARELLTGLTENSAPIPLLGAARRVQSAAWAVRARMAFAAGNRDEACAAIAAARTAFARGGSVFAGHETYVLADLPAKTGCEKSDSENDDGLLLDTLSPASPLRDGRLQYALL
jgi:Protein kinase domain